MRESAGIARAALVQARGGILILLVILILILFRADRAQRD